jgi:hypothetical protein
LIFEILQQELKQAIRAKDAVILNYIRSIKALTSEYQVANFLDRTIPASDDIMIKIISAHKKSLEKAIVLLQRGNGESLIDEYKKEIEYCNKFIPQSNDNKELYTLVFNIIKELGVKDIKQLGKVMTTIMKNNKDLNGSIVKQIASEILNG